MAERTDFFIAPESLTKSYEEMIWDSGELSRQAIAYLEHIVEEYGTRDRLTIWGLLSQCILPTLQEQLTFHEKIKEVMLFPEFAHSNLQKELEIIAYLLKHFEQILPLGEQKFTN